ncbi:hypothetical protein Rctr71_014 [Virus Rctr71]|nr:hypothetical protein Rctr71_014 [Virus Rctr71]
MLSEYLTTKEGERKYGLADRWLRTLCEQGRLQAVKRGREWLIFEPSLRQYVEESKRK